VHGARCDAAVRPAGFEGFEGCRDAASIIGLHGSLGRSTRRIITGRCWLLLKELEATYTLVIQACDTRARAMKNQRSLAGSS
jgi:hypothetical protein